MTIAGLRWRGTRGSDVHCIAGLSTRALNDGLEYSLIDPATGVADWTSLTTVRILHPAAAPRFTPRFRGTVDAAGNTTGHGVRVDRGTGSVSAPGWPTTPTLWTFLIEVTVSGVLTTPDFTP